MPPANITAVPLQADRLEQIDALRAIAALSVLAFHYTTRYEQVFMHTEPLPVHHPYGAMGVPLFFAVSGFVIFMTIERMKTPSDFVVWRFSRLFPVYWASVAITWCVVMGVGLPGHEVPLRDALANLTMLQSFASIDDVDGVYWSLQVELVFYTWILLLWVTGLLRRPVAVLAAWVGLALAAAVAERAGWQPPYVPSYFLLLEWIPWFAVGMIAYVTLRDGFERKHGVVVAMALATVAIDSGLGASAVAVASAAAVFAASRRRLKVLEWRPLVYVGLISYPLYLLHANIGYVVIAELERRAIQPAAAIVAAVAVALLLAALLHHGVEKPASRALRVAYKRHQASAGPAVFDRAPWAALSILCLFAAAGSLFLTTRIRHATEPLPPLSRVNALAERPAPGACAPLEPGTKQVLLIALGQSNAASHAERAVMPQSVRVLTEGGCARVTDPLPGTTGTGASIWSRVPGLVRARTPVEVVIAPFAVESSRIKHWLDPDTGLRQRLLHLLATARDSGIPVLAVAWQQGESDGNQGTEARSYAAGLLEIQRLVEGSGVDAPLVVAKSTWCDGRVSEPIRRAVDFALASGRNLVAGPDTDRLGRGYRLQRCHFNRAGRVAASRMWADRIVELLARRPPGS